MDTRVFCVYNVSRGALLSSKVTVADGANQPLTILRVLVGGLAIDSKSGLWMSPLHALPSVPRLFPFDLIYLDEELRVLDLTEFVPGAEFPPYRRDMASALILPSQSLQTTQTGRDDQLLICPAEEMERQISAFSNGSVASRTSPLPNAHPPRSPIPEFEPVPRAALGSRLNAAAKADSAVAVAEKQPGPELRADVAERDTGPSLRKTTPPKPAVTAVESRADNAPLGSQNHKQPGRSQEQPQASKSVLPATGIELPSGIVVKKKPESNRAASEATSPSQSDAPVISITEVILERPRAAEPPTIVGVHGEALHGDIEDLFSNWMDTPSPPSKWKARSAVPVRPVKPPTAPAVADTSRKEAKAGATSPSGASDTASQPAPVAQVKQVEIKAQVEPDVIKAGVNQLETLPVEGPRADAASARSQELNDKAPVQAKEVPIQAKSELSEVHPELRKPEVGAPSANSSKPAKLPASNSSTAPASNAATAPTSTGAPAAHPHPRQASTSTVAQYGMWRTSLPTAVLPVASSNGTAKEPDSRVVPGKSSREAARTVPAGAKASTPKAASASTSVEQPGSSAPQPQVETAIQSPSPSVARVSKEAQPISPKPPVQAAKAAPARTPEAVSRRPVVQDNFLAGYESRKPLNKTGTSVTSDRRSAEELAQPTVEEKSTGRSSRPTPATTEAVDIVQRRLGIGQANPAEPAAAGMPKTELAKAEKTVSAPIENVEALDLGTHREQTPYSPNSLAPSEIEIATRKGRSKVPPARRVEAEVKASTPPLTLAERFKRWLNPDVKANGDRRRAHRRYVPGMVAHYYTGGAPKPHDIADISMTGFYLLTEDRWMPDTMIQMTLQKPCAKGERKQSITVLSRIVRRGSDGVAAQFVMPEGLDPHSHEVQPSQTTDKFALARFI